MTFSFKDHTKEEKKKIAEKEKLIKESTEASAERLRECLSSDSFIKYKKELKECHKALIEIGISTKNEILDNDKRLKLYDNLFTRAEVLGLLLKSITKDSL